jgi:hypothetical protein
MEVSNVKQVRFGKIVETGGKPEAYLAFSDPDKDPSFVRAAKESRVVTIKQEPTSKRKDFGIVGYVKEKYATYLIFPKSLKEFDGQRVIGIDYSILQSADVRIGGKVPAPRKKPETKKERTRSAAIPKPKPPKPAPKSEPKPEKPKPQPKRFRVEIQITTVDRKEVEVTAWNQSEAKANAIREVEASSNFDKARMTVKVVKVREEQ